MFFMIFAAAVIITLVFVFWPKQSASLQLPPRAAFAECLSTKGVTMYGLNSCPNCQLQQSMFEDDFKRIHFVDCQLNQDECTQKNIQGYPTWMYNGQSVMGVQTFQQLSQFSGCAAP